MFAPVTARLPLSLNIIHFILARTFERHTWHSLSVHAFCEKLTEMQVDPYPNITLHMNDDLSACVILSSEGEDSLHLTMFLQDCSLRGPMVTIHL